MSEVFNFKKLGDVDIAKQLNKTDNVLITQGNEVKMVSNTVFNISDSSSDGDNKNKGSVIFKGPLYEDDTYDYLLDQNDNVVSNIDVLNAFKQGVVRLVYDDNPWYSYGTMTGFNLDQVSDVLQLTIHTTINGDCILRPDGTLESGI